MEDALMHSNRNNEFEVYHYHASLMICIPRNSEGALIYSFYSLS